MNTVIYITKWMITYFLHIKKVFTGESFNEWRGVLFEVKPTPTVSDEHVIWKLLLNVQLHTSVLQLQQTVKFLLLSRVTKRKAWLCLLHVVPHYFYATWNRWMQTMHLYMAWIYCEVHGKITKLISAAFISCIRHFVRVKWNFSFQKKNSGNVFFDTFNPHTFFLFFFFFCFRWSRVWVTFHTFTANQSHIYKYSSSVSLTSL